MKPIAMLCLAGLAALGIAAPEPARAASDPVHTGTFSNTAVGGHDPVAYFTQGKPVKGDRKFSTEWNGAEWRFVSAENLEAFKAAPEKYAPQFGGYCAWAVSEGYTAPGDPDYWKIVDGKLYLNYNDEIQKRWEKDIPGHIGRGEGNWPAVLAK